MDTRIRYLERVGDDLRAAAIRESVARDSVARERRRDGRRRMSAARSSVGWGRRHRAVVRAGAAAAALAIAGVVGFSVTNAGQSVVSSVASGGSERSVRSMSPVGGTSGPASVEPIPLPADRAVPGISQASGTAGAERQAPLGPPGRNAAGDGAPGSTPIGQGIPDVSKVIESADLEVVVAPRTFAARFQAASEIAARLGGFVESSDEGTSSGHLVMRVPARSFNAARRDLKALAVSVSSERIDGQDVTAQFVDLKARLEILQARKDALVELLGQASSLGTILRLQNVVDDVLTRIEELKGQIALINDRSSNATISVTVRERGVSVAPTVDRPSLGRALSNAIAGFLAVLYAVVVGLGYLVPIGVAGLVAWLAVRTLRRRRRAPVPEA